MNRSVPRVKILKRIKKYRKTTQPCPLGVRRFLSTLTKLKIGFECWLNELVHSNRSTKEPRGLFQLFNVTNLQFSSFLLIFSSILRVLLSFSFFNSAVPCEFFRRFFFPSDFCEWILLLLFKEAFFENFYLFIKFVYIWRKSKGRKANTTGDFAKLPFIAGFVLFAFKKKKNGGKRLD